jgi:hypothetical protein
MTSSAGALSCTVIVSATPSAPLGLSSTVSGRVATLTFTAPGGATGFSCNAAFSNGTVATATATYLYNTDYQCTFALPSTAGIAQLSVSALSGTNISPAVSNYVSFAAAPAPVKTTTVATKAKAKAKVKAKAKK